MTLFGGRSFVRLALGCALIAFVPAHQAHSQAHLDKHARKIHRKLAKYPSGRYLHLVLRNGSSDYGAMGRLSENSMTFVDADNNTSSTYTYAEIDKVKTDKEPIGEGSEPVHHIPHLVPILVGVAAAGAAYAVVETVH